MVKTGKSEPGMATVVEGELERELGGKVLKFRSTCEGRAEVKSGGGKPLCGEEVILVTVSRDTGSGVL